MRWLKRWSYLVLLVTMGVVYLWVVDDWQVYAEPLDQAKAFFHRMLYGEQAFPGQVVESPQTAGDSHEMLVGVVEREDVSGVEGGEDQASVQAGETVTGVDGQEGSDEETAGQEGQQGGVAEDGFWDGSDPVYMTVEDDYFADAVFIGDSRTVGMREYGGLEEISTFYASKGMTIYRLFSEEIVEVPGQRQKLTVEDALLNNEFKKIYLMVGINEMGMGTVETFTEKYSEVVDYLLELQPNAIIYIQGILKVTTARSQQGDYINNEGIVARNEALAELADNRRIFYLDVNPLICDDTGGMESSYTTDGVHLKAQYIEIWKNYLKEHAIVLEQ